MDNFLIWWNFLKLAEIFPKQIIFSWAIMLIEAITQSKQWPYLSLLKFDSRKELQFSEVIMNQDKSLKSMDSMMNA